jgi:hypothetical protein
VPVSTTQAAVKRALFYALKSNPEIAWEITYGDPLESTASREAVYIGAAMAQDRAEEEPVAFRKGRRDEDYQIVVHCDTSNGTGPLETEEKATEVAAQVELTVLENSTLGVEGVYWIRPAGIDLQTGPTSEGFRTTAKVRLSVKARLTWL